MVKGTELGAYASVEDNAPRLCLALDQSGHEVETVPVGLQVDVLSSLTGKHAIVVAEIASVV